MRCVVVHVYEPHLSRVLETDLQTYRPLSLCFRRAHFSYIATSDCIAGPGVTLLFWSSVRTSVASRVGMRRCFLSWVTWSQHNPIANIVRRGERLSQAALEPPKTQPPIQ